MLILAANMLGIGKVMESDTASVDRRTATKIS